jgi:hypothetical protein
MDFSDFMESDRAAKKRDPKEYARGVAADEKQAAKAYAKTAEGIAERKAENEARKAANIQKSSFPLTTAAFEEMAKSDAERAERRAARGAASSLDEFNAKTSRGGGGGGAGIPKVGPKKPTDMRTGGKVSSASKRADGCATKGKTKGRFV